MIAFVYTVGEFKPAPESNANSPATPPSSAPSTHPSVSLTTLPLASDDEVKAEIKADVAVVGNLKELEILFGRTLVQVKRLFCKSDLSDACYSLIPSSVLKILSDVTILTNSCDIYSETTLTSSTFPFSNNLWDVLTIIS